jgi:hypothetical protein
MSYPYPISKVKNYYRKKPINLILVNTFNLFRFSEWQVRGFQNAYISKQSGGFEETQTTAYYISKQSVGSKKLKPQQNNVGLFFSSLFHKKLKETKNYEAKKKLFIYNNNDRIWKFDRFFNKLLVNFRRHFTASRSLKKMETPRSRKLNKCCQKDKVR